MRIAFVVQRYGEGVVGGAEKYVRDLAAGLVKDGHAIEVVTSCATSYHDWADVYEPGLSIEGGVEIHRVPVSEPRPNDRFLPLHVRAVDTGQPQLWPWSQQRWASLMGPELEQGRDAVAEVAGRADVTVMVGYHYAHSLGLTRAAAAWSPTVVVPTAHPEGAFFVGRVRQMFEYSDLVVCLSDAEAELVAQLRGSAEGISVVGCPVAQPPEPTAVEVAETRRRYSLGDDPYLVVVGRIDPAKGSDEAVDYFRAVRNGPLPSLKLVVVGPGQLSGDLTGIVPTGFVSEEDKLALIRGSMALLQPSHMESFSIALMEAWLLSRPAIVQGTNGVLHEHITRSGGGVPYTDLESFETAAVALAGSSDLRAGCAAAGKAYCQRDFGWHAVGPSFIKAMERAAEAGHRRLSTPLSVRLQHG